MKLLKIFLIGYAIVLNYNSNAQQSHLTFHNFIGQDKEFIIKNDVKENIILVNNDTAISWMETDLMYICFLDNNSICKWVLINAMNNDIVNTFSSVIESDCVPYHPSYSDASLTYTCDGYYISFPKTPPRDAKEEPFIVKSVPPNAISKIDSVRIILNRISYINAKNEVSYKYNLDCLYTALEVLNDDSMIDISLWINSASDFLRLYKSSNEGASLILNFELQECLSTVYCKRGALKYTKTDYNGAIKDFKKSSDSTSIKLAGGTLYNIGLCYFELRNLDTACKYMSDAGEAGYNDAYKFISKYCDISVH